MTDQTDAAAALAELDASRARLAETYDYPSARHLAFGAMFGVLIAAQALPRGTSILGSTLVIIAAALLRKWDMRRTGTFLNGWRKGRTRMVTVIMLLSVLALLGPALHYGLRGVWQVPLALGAVAVPLGVAFSYWWQAIYLRELREGGAR